MDEIMTEKEQATALMDKYVDLNGLKQRRTGITKLNTRSEPPRQSWRLWVL